jgi:hypothetical protein
LLQQTLEYQGNRVVFIPGWPEYKDNITASRRYLDETLGMPVSSLRYRPAKPVFVLVDEAQTTKTDRFFWIMFLKSYVQRREINIFVVMASAYGSAGRTAFDQPKLTPPFLKYVQRIGLFWKGDTENEPAGLHFTEEEARQCVEIKTSHTPDRPRYSKELQEYLFNLSSGHCGALSTLIDIINEDKVGDAPWDDDERVLFSINDGFRTCYEPPPRKACQSQCRTLRPSIARMFVAQPFIGPSYGLHSEEVCLSGCTSPTKTDLGA